MTKIDSRLAQVHYLFEGLLSGDITSLTPKHKEILVFAMVTAFPELKSRHKRAEKAMSKNVVKDRQKSKKMTAIVKWLRVSLTVIIMALVVVLFAMAYNAFAYTSAEQTLQEASGLETWRQELLQFEGRLNSEQKAMWGKLSDADKRVVMANNMQRLAEQDKAAQQHRVDSATQEAQGARQEAQQARALTYTPVQATPQKQAPYGYDPEHPNLQQQAKILTDTQTSEEWIVDRSGPGGVFRPVSETTNTYILPAPVIAPAKSSATADIDGSDMTSWLSIADSASPEIVSALEKSIQQSGQNFAKKLDQLHEANVMQFNVDLYKVTTSRQATIGWLLLPLLTVCSLCGVYIFRAVTSDRRERMKIDYDTLYKGRN